MAVRALKGAYSPNFNNIKRIQNMQKQQNGDFTQKTGAFKKGDYC